MVNLFSEVIKNRCSCSQDMSGEYNSSFDIDFMLTEPVSFEVLGMSHKIDRVKMQNGGFMGFDDETELIFANEQSQFKGITIPKYALRALYRRLLKEQKNGVLKSWCFDDDIAERYFRN